MRLGFNLPQMGPAATPEAMVRVAQRAEELGYDGVWVAERLLYPIEPQTPYMGGVPRPEAYKYVLDPLESLTYVAGFTSRITLGTSTINIPYYNPVMLARRLTTLDVLSNGRLRLGLGQGWSKDEFDAVGASMKERGRRADEFISVLKEIWTTDPVEFHGEFYHAPRSIILPKPVQKPHPPIYLAAFSASSLQRTAVMANGWLSADVPPAELEPMIAGLRGMAQEAGRDPDDLEIVVLANIVLTEEPLGGQRNMCNGSPDQIKADIAASRELGIDELHFDPSYSPDGTSLEGFMKTMERMKQLADAS